MSSSTDQKSSSAGKLPGLAIGVVILGVVASLAIYGLSFVPGNGSQEIDWDTKEEITAPPVQNVGNGQFGVTRTSLSALAPNEDGLLLYRVAGVVRLDSGGRQASKVRCDIFSRAQGDTRMARSGHLRAAWPRPSSGVDVHRQAVPETSTVKFTTGDAKKVDLPIRDVLRSYVNTSAMTTVEWEGYTEDDQNWIWELPDGSGAGAVTLPWLVIFEAETRPKGKIECVATIDGKRSRIVVPFRQQEWPIADDEPNAGDADTGDVSNVE